MSLLPGLRNFLLLALFTFFILALFTITANLQKTHAAACSYLFPPNVSVFDPVNVTVSGQTGGFFTARLINSSGDEVSSDSDIANSGSANLVLTLPSPPESSYTVAAGQDADLTGHVAHLCSATVGTVVTVGSTTSTPPAPNPCENAQETNFLTDNFVTDEFGNPPEGMEFEVTASGTQGQLVSISKTITYTVDFSKLQAVFGNNNADYLEGKYQDEGHRTTDLYSLRPTQFNNYHGPGQKTTPKVMLDMLKVNYVEYVYANPHLAESISGFSDSAGQNEKTVYELVTEYGQPLPPSLGGNSTSWLNNWGKYWPKIPTAYNEFYEGKLVFKLAVGQEYINAVKLGDKCPSAPIRTIKFIMPEFFRTTATSGQLNQVIVPKAAQSEDANNVILGAAKNTTNVLADFVKKCIDLAAQNPVSRALRKVVKVSLEKLTPVKVANAATLVPAQRERCLKIEIRSKTGSAPYCAMPPGQLQANESCTGTTDELRIDQENTNVICTFHITWSMFMTIGVDTDPDADPLGFDSCTDDNSDGIYDCTAKVALWPVFRIPWLAEIWNNALDSQVTGGVTSHQEDGRPGVYANFKPKTIDIFRRQQLEEEDKATLDELNDDCLGSGAGVTFCQTMIFRFFARRSLSQLPGQPESGQGAGYKQVFIGATDCGKEFSRDVALKPKALQTALGINAECKAVLSAGAPTTSVPGTGPGASPPPPPPSGEGLYYYIKYGDTSINVADPQAVKNTANSSWPGNNINDICPGGITCWDYVIQQSISRGVSPAFSIAIWWEEGGFGGAGAYSEFGCFPGGDTSQIIDFQSSLSCFLNFTANEHPYNPADPYGSFTEWVSYFCGPAAVPICSNNPNFIDRLASVYNTVAPGAIVPL